MKMGKTSNEIRNKFLIFGFCIRFSSIDIEKLRQKRYNNIYVRRKQRALRKRIKTRQSI